MVNVAVSGAAGRMGMRIIANIASTKGISLTGAVERIDNPSAGKDAGEIAGVGKLGVDIVSDIKALDGNFDVLIDFSSPEVSAGNAVKLVQTGKAIVIGTTGIKGESFEKIKDASAKIPVVMAPNMSVGVNLLFKVVSDVSKVLGDDFDVEVLEIHHRLKKDAPSGTALRLAEVLAKSLNRDLDKVGIYERKGVTGERTKEEIGLQTLRMGDVVGEHTVYFGGIGERIEITHKASSRDTFAKGAIRAALWVSGKPAGLYDMQDVLGLK